LSGSFDLETHLRAAGAAQILLAAAHPLIAWHLGWKRESTRMSALSAQVFWVHTYFVVLTLLLFGLLSLLLPGELLAPSPLARAVLLGLAVFWGARLYAQHFVYRAEHWRGHPFNTAAHSLFSLLWAYLTVVYAAALFLSQWRR
jgi:hypothetical protein